MKGDISPVVVFVYKRLYHTRKCISSLIQNKLAKYTPLYIFCDGSKNEADSAKVKEVRAYLHETLDNTHFFKTTTIIERENNVGLMQNIKEGITQIVNKYGKVIVVEDDIVTARGFLNYMNDALNFYENTPRVMAISGFCAIRNKKNFANTFFMRYFDCWGWATWKRAWDIYKRDPEALLAKNYSESVLKDFNIQGSCNQWQQVIDNATGKICTWAIFFYAAIFFNDGLVLYSKEDMCKNIGNDNTGVHCGSTNIYYRKRLTSRLKINFTSNIEKSQRAEDALRDFYNNMSEIFEEIRKKDKKKRKRLSYRVYLILKYNGVRGLLQKISSKLHRN